MAYNSDIPQSTDDPSQSQGQIVANFQELNTFLSVNHVALNDSDQGKHNFLNLPEQSSAPATAANEGGLYTKEVSGATQLFYRDESSGTERQITNAFTAATNGTLTIPGGLLIQWGFASGIGDDSQVDFNTNFSGSAYNVQCTLVRSDTNSRFVYVQSGSVTNQKFNIKSNSTSTDMYWWAVGASP